MLRRSGDLWGGGSYSILIMELVVDSSVQFRIDSAVPKN